MDQDNYVANGFHRLEEKLLTNKPPEINWGSIYTKAQKKVKIRYLEKLCASMNHAAFLIQKERDELNKLCEMKEAQIQSLKTAIDQNNNMIQGEITKANEERQLYNAEIVKLRKELRETNGGNNA